MGVVAKARADATRVARGKPRRSGRALTSQVTASDTEDFLKQFPIQLRERVLQKGIRKAAAVVRTGARSNLNRSKQTGTRAEWSQKVQAQREGKADLWKSISTALRKYGSTILGIVGARHASANSKWGGNHAHLVEFGGVYPRWGDGHRPSFQPPDPFMRTAAKETRPQQQAAIENTAKNEWDKV